MRKGRLVPPFQRGGGGIPYDRGVVVKDISFHKDSRGWLAELFRIDELGKELHPLMGYVSMTLPGVSRGRTST